MRCNCCGENKRNFRTWHDNRMCVSCVVSHARREKFWSTTGIPRNRQSKTAIYQVWKAMKRRCDVTTAVHYDYYGGRGITYCDQWKDFATFKQWAESNGYEKGLWLDRRSNDGNYQPENCRWVTPSASNFNRVFSRVT